MRNPKRIKLLLELINKYWKVRPDLRFGQIMFIIQMELIEDRGSEIDFFNIEDEVTIKALEKLLKKENTHVNPRKSHNIFN